MSIRRSHHPRATRPRGLQRKLRDGVRAPSSSATSRTPERGPHEAAPTFGWWDNRQLHRGQRREPDEAPFVLHPLEVGALRGLRTGPGGRHLRGLRRPHSVPALYSSCSLGGLFGHRRRYARASRAALGAHRRVCERRPSERLKAPILISAWRNRDRDRDSTPSDTGGVAWRRSKQRRVPVGRRSRAWGTEQCG